jgi:small-conductance mechanosensitive channel
MNFTLPTFNEIVTSLGAMEYFIFTINIIIFIFAAKILKFLNHNKTKEAYKKKLKRLRSTNLSLFLLYSLTTFVEHGTFQQMIMTVTAGIGLFLFWEFVMYYIAKTYSKIDEHGRIEETYQSDIFQGIATIALVIISINIVANIWAWDSMWQTGSVVASIGAFLAITHSSWLPDNISGLITLHDRNIEAGDVIEFHLDGELVQGYVGKITLRDTTIYDLVIKKPIYIRNSKFRDTAPIILSKHDSSSKDGILRYVDLNIGYSTSSERVEEFAEEVFKKANEITKSLIKDKGIRVEVESNGDYAVCWRFFYYTNARNMKESEFAINRAAKDVAETYEDLSLDTPQLVVYTKS